MEENKLFFCSKEIFSVALKIFLKSLRCYKIPHGLTQGVFCARSPTYDEYKKFYASKPPIDVLFELRPNAEFNQVVLRRIQGKYVWFFHRPQRRSMTPHTIETPVLRAENKQDHQREGNSEKSFPKVLAMI